MKRLLSLVLCLVLFFSVGVVQSVAASGYTQQLDASTPLFNVAGENNKGGQECIPDGTYLRGVRVYLQNGVANNPITLSVYKGSIALDSTSPRLVHDQLILDNQATGWVSLYFSAGIVTNPGEVYSFTLNTTKGAALFGKASGTVSSCLGLNYDASLGGWTRGQEAAFQLIITIPVEEIIEKINTLPATITLKDELLVTSIANGYNNLSYADKQLVTNAQVLLDAVQTIETLNNAPRDEAAAEIETALERLEITRNSYNDLKAINEKNCGIRLPLRQLPIQPHFQLQYL